MSDNEPSNRRNIGVFFEATEEYNGGINYFYNLMHAVNLNNKEITFIFFVGDDMSEEIITRFSAVSSVIRTPWLRRTGLASILRRLLRKVRSPLILARLASKYNIDVFSHICKPYRKLARVKGVFWIPDFQYLHYPNFFGGRKVCRNLDNANQHIVKYADRVIVSSNDSLKDLNTIVPGAELKTTVLNFVAAVNDSPMQPVFAQDFLYGGDKVLRSYFYVPNQFWKHKNHELVLKSIKILKDRQLNPLVVFSGNKNDFRDSGQDVYDDFSAMAISLGVQSNIYVVGNITYPNVLWLMKNCNALINPSLFEGWSSVVEESKSLGVRLLLSDIDVHQEQAPPTGLFFQSE